jgi:acetolactate synthase-1/2/3 large subunit
MLVADYIVERLLRLEVRHVFGVGGANIEDLFAAVQRRRPEIRAVLDKHEHAAGTAADAYARLRGFSVVMTTSGGGAMNLVHSIAEARASRVPVLAIVGEPPSALQGRGAFQDTSGKGGTVDALAVFRAAAAGAVRASSASDVPRCLDEAMAIVCGPNPGPAVVLLAKDFQTAELAECPFPARPQTDEAVADIGAALRALESRPVVLLSGAAVARAHAEHELAELAERLDAGVVTTPDGRDAFDNRDPRFLGVSGAMGHPAALGAIEAASVVVLAGTALPLLARQGLEATLARKTLVSIGPRRALVTGAPTIDVPGGLRATLRALVEGLPPRGSPKPATGGPADAAFESSAPLSGASILRAVERLAPPGSVVLADAGNTGATAIHHLRAPRGGRWLVAMGMAGMGYTFGAATGAAFATAERCIVLAGDGAFFMNGLEIHTAVEHGLPITYVIFDNRAHGMCLVRERLLLGENAGYNAFRRSRIGAGLAAMFPGLSSTDCETEGELAAALERSFAGTGPAVVAAHLRDVEVPPFAAFRQASPGTVTVAREASDGR